MLPIYDIVHQQISPQTRNKKPRIFFLCFSGDNQNPLHHEDGVHRFLSDPNICGEGVTIDSDSFPKNWVELCDSAFEKHVAKLSEAAAVKLENVESTELPAAPQDLQATPSLDVSQSQTLLDQNNSKLDAENTRTNCSYYLRRRPKQTGVDTPPAACTPKKKKAKTSIAKNSKKKTTTKKPKVTHAHSDTLVDSRRGKQTEMIGLSRQELQSLLDQAVTRGMQMSSNLPATQSQSHAQADSDPPTPKSDHNSQFVFNFYTK